jgi:hypothetical protein
MTSKADNHKFNDDLLSLKRIETMRFANIIKYYMYSIIDSYKIFS